MSNNTPEAETASGTIGIWGPKDARQSTAKERTEGSASQVFSKVKDFASSGDTQGYFKKEPVKRRTWGLRDVALGFGLFVFFQLLLTGGLLVKTITGSLSAGGAVEDTDVIFEQTLNIAVSGPFLLASSALMYLGWMIAIRRATFKKGLHSYAKDFWLKFNWKRDIPLGLLFAATLRGVEWLTMVALTSIGVDMSTGGNTDIIVNQSGIWYFINAIVIAAFAAPFFEELFFRGLFLQGALRNFRKGRFPKPQTFFGRIVNDLTPGLFEAYASHRRWVYRNRNWLAVALSSTVFGFMHFQGTDTFAQWFVIIQTGLIGVMLALIVLKTKRLGLAITSHIFFNLSGVILATLLAS